MKHLRIILILGLLLCALILPTQAQDSTDAQPVDITPIASQEAVPVIVEMGEGSGDLTINNNTDTAPDTSESTEAPKFLSLTLGEFLAAVVGTVGLFLAFGKIMWDANQNPGGPSIDTRLSTRVDAATQDRTYMESMERAYAMANAATQKALDSTVQVLQIIAPQTGLKADDAVLRALKDIQTPGVPIDTSPVNLPTSGAAAPYPDPG